MSSDRLDYLVSGLTDLTDAVIQEAALTKFDLRRLLRFLSRVVQVVEQAFQDILALMIEFKYFTEADKQAGRLPQLAKELELLQARSRYRDAEEICSRLHHLTYYYHTEIEPITRDLTNSQEWRDMYGLLNEHEGYIIRLVEESARELRELLPGSNVRKINSAAARRVDEIRESLSQLRALNSWILGLSGSVGLLELTEAKVPGQKTNLEVNMGDIISVSGQVGAVGRGSQAQNMTFLQVGGQVAETIDLDELSKELARLRQAMKNESVTIEQDIAVSEIGQAEQAAKSKDSTKLAEHLSAAGKWALDIATRIGVPLAVEALKQVIAAK